jgi:hypothetical protein
MKECLECKKLYEFKREASKFCSDKCRVKWNRHHPKETDTVSKMELKVLYNAMLDMVGKISVVPSTPSDYGKPVSVKVSAHNYHKNEEPEISLQDEYMAKIDGCEYQYELEQLALKIEKDGKLDRIAKMQLISYGKIRYEKL